MEILGKLLGSLARVKIMRLFLLNQKIGFNKKDIEKRSRVNKSILGKELNLLVSIGFIKKRTKDYIFNSSFKYGTEILGLLVNSDTIDSDAILDIFKKTGKVKLIIISGVFIKNEDSRVDLLIVGDKLIKSKIDEGVHKLEAEIGTELVYAVFDSKEFAYRLNMYDKLIRDILDFPNEIIFQSKELNLPKATRQV